MKKTRRLLDEYRFPGFSPRAGIKGIYGDPQALLISLSRTEKKRHADNAGRFIGAITTQQRGGYAIYPAATGEYAWKWRFAGSSAGSAGR
jgi:hypothetical protein